MKPRLQLLIGTPSARMSGLMALIALMGVDAFPGFYFQTRIPHIVAAAAVWGIYFCLLHLGLRAFRRFFGRHMSPAAVEAVLLAAAIYGVLEEERQVRGLGPANDLYFYGIAVVTVLCIWFAVDRLSSKKACPFRIAAGALWLLPVVLFYGLPGGGKQPPKAPADRTIPARYPWEKVVYGPDHTIDFGTADYSAYARVPARQEKFRLWQNGYDLQSIPFEGEIYIPRTEEKVPVLFFVHGNHNMIEDNMEGYGYLGRYLAARGIGFVSVEESHFNAYLGKGLRAENDARALFLLDHVDKILHESALKDRIDPERIYLGGHSRGGEAAAIAAALSDLPYDPDTGKKTPEIPVAGVLSVAPTDGQFRPGDAPVELNVPYFLIQGTHDQDVASMEGMNQYERTSADRWQILIDYANHTQFNENWGRLDREGLSALYLNTADILEARVQRAYLELLAYAFVADETIFEDLAAYLPDGGYALRRDSPSKVLADFEEDADLTTGTAEGVRIDGKDAAIWREGAFSPSGRGGENRVLTFSGRVEIALPAGGGTDLVMDVAAKRGAPDFTLILEDAAGERVSFPSDARTLHASLSAGFLKWQHLADIWEYKTALETIAFGAEEMRAQNPAFSLGALTKIVIESRGEMQIDRIRTTEKKSD